MARLNKPLIRQLEGLWGSVEELQNGGGGSGPHTHTIGNITNLQAELDGKQPAGSYALTAHDHDGDYQPLGDYAAETHGHIIADVPGLQAALDGKQASGSYSLSSHNHDGVYQPVGSYLTSITSGDVTTALGYVPTSVTGLTGTQSVAAFKTGLSLAKDDVGLGSADNTADSAKAVLTATRFATPRNINGVAFDGSGNITINAVDSTARVAEARTITTTAPLTGGGDLSANRTFAISAATTSAAGSMSAADKTKLDGVATGATANATDAQLRDRSTHTGTQAAGTVTGLATVATSGSAADLTGNLAVARLNGGSGASGSTYWRGDGTWATPGGGSDPWTYVRTTADFTTSSATAVDIVPGSGPALSFTPLANKRYEFEARLRLRTATATVGPRPGLAWPTGFMDGTAEVRATASATTEINAFGNPNAAVIALSTGLPNTTQSHPGYIGGEIEMGGSPSGNVRATLQSETGGTNVTCKAGSWLRYREIT